MSDQTPQSPARLPGLDVLRALAILLVLISHGPAPLPNEMAELISAPLNALKRGGWIGVDLFFVLSGFLVSGLLMREHLRHGSIRPISFLVRRGWKLYPPLAVLIVFTFFQAKVQLGYWPTDRLIANLLWIQNYKPGLHMHTWSLAVEEHAYFLLAATFGLAAWIAAKRKTDLRLHWIPWAFIPIGVVGLVLRIQAANAAPFDSYLHQFPTQLRIDSLLSGVVLAYFYHYHPARLSQLIVRYRPLLLVGALALLLRPFLMDLGAAKWNYSYGMSVNYLGALLLLCAMLPMKQRNDWLSQSVTAVGRHSYSIYLWHMTTYHIMLGLITGDFVGKPAVDMPYALHMGLFLAATILSGIAMSVLIEVPTLRLRERLSPSRSGTLNVIQPDQREGSTFTPLPATGTAIT